MLRFIGNFDYVIFHAINQLAGHNNVLDRWMLLSADSHAISGVILVSLIWYLWFKRPKEEREHLFCEMIGIVIAAPLARGLQLLFPFHARPLHSQLVDFHYASGVNPEELNHWSSFPSDHAAVYYALAGVILMHDRKLGALASLWATCMVLPRIYLGYHWPSDILCGLLIGIGVVWLCRTFLPKRVVAPFIALERNGPGYFYAGAFFLSYQTATLVSEVREFIGWIRLLLFRSS